jgi:hypothetical protein
MKKIITLFAFVFCASIAMAQTTPALKVDASGNVGVNQGTPSEKLHVKGKFLLEPEAGILGEVIGNPSNVGRLTLLNGGTDQEDAASYLTMNGTTTNASFVFSGRRIDFRVNKASGGAGNFGQAFVRFTDSQRVGIGTTSPGQTLELGSGNAAKPGGGAWLASSDKRLKKNINQFELGLDEVLRINPVSYEYNGKGNTQKSVGQIFVGVIAQEFQKVDPSSVKPVHMIQTEEYLEEDQIGNKIVVERIVDEGDYLTVDPSNITYMLVNAIKEQQKMISDLVQKNEELSQRINSLDAVDTKINASLDGVGAFIGQNQPNPFNAETSIDYFIPSDAKDAKFNVYDLNGKLIKTIKVSETGQGTLSIQSDGAPAGNYVYTLIVDGIQVDTKKMIIAK